MIHLRPIYALALFALTPLSPAQASAHDGPAFIPAGGAADAPAGFVAMCARDFRLCGDAPPAGAAPIPAESWHTGGIGPASVATHAAPRGAAPVPAEAASLDGKAQDKLLEKVNWAVNTSIIQRSDQEIFGIDEYWARTGNARGASGDCEDLALEKRMRLIEAGFPADRLFFAVVYHRRYGLHTLLVARTDRGDRVLDSLNGQIMSWQDVPYSWLRLQTPGAPYLWTRVGNL